MVIKRNLTILKLWAPPQPTCATLTAQGINSPVGHLPRTGSWRNHQRDSGEHDRRM